MRALTREEKRAAFQELTSLTAYRPAENSLILSDGILRARGSTAPLPDRWTRSTAH
jgi:hypothetical protein